MNIVPINGHVHVNPIEEDSVFASADPKFEEKGVVVSWDGDTNLMVGDVVNFDAWTAAKYAVSGNPSDGYYYLVPFKEIRAIVRI